MPVFAQGGGLSYVREPSFGYLLGFVPGAWVCGWWVFRQLPKLENFAIASLMGLGIIHAVGIFYLLGLTFFKLGSASLVNSQNLLTNLSHYSLVPLPGQLVVVCVVAVLTGTLRRLLFY
jgi:biotin transport system substrate-specific component